jgi:hypothetical protein
MKMHLLVAVTVLAGVTMLAGTASASSNPTPYDVGAKITGVGPDGGVLVNVHYTTFNGTHVSEWGYAGEYEWKTTYNNTGNYDAVPPKGGTFSTFCFDVQGNIYLGHTYDFYLYEGKDQIVAHHDTKRTPPGGALTGDQYDLLLKLFGLYWQHPGEWASNTEAAAFGSAVWEIVWEYGDNSSHPAVLPYSVSTGLFRVTGSAAVVAAANDMLTGVMSSSAVPVGELYALINPCGGQDQMIAFGVGTRQDTVPEPLTMVSVVLGIGGVGAYVRRRMKAQAAA